MLQCEHCGREPCHPTELRLWTEYRVGHVESPDRFWLCAGCQRDETIDPIQLWAAEAEVHTVQPR